MIINIWSTARAGGKYLSLSISQEVNGLWLPEFLNAHTMQWYTCIHRGRQYVVTDHIPGCRHSRYYLDSQGYIRKRVYFTPRVNTVQQEYQWRVSLLESMNPQQVLVMFNQVWPLDHSIRQRLDSISDRIIYLYREDKRAQLGSFVIAKSTGEWVRYHEVVSDIGVVPDIDLSYLREQIIAYRVWEGIDRGSHEVICYEHILFVSRPGLPVRQNLDYRSRLSDCMWEEIDRLVSQHYPTLTNSVCG